jgi:tetratricopeptide (TPR) repeat protein
MKTQLAVLAVCCAALHSAAQTGNLSDWQKLLSAKKDPAAARALCTSFEQSKVLAEQVEAEKCLANVALWGADTVRLEKEDNGQVAMLDEYIPAAVDECLTHLNRGLQLAPQDLSIHQGRLHVLEISRRYGDMPKALDESCTIYKGKDVPYEWLAYSSELINLGQYHAGLEFMKVLDAHYPNNPDILGNMGAFLSMLKRDPEAIECLKKATDLAPKDPINTWDLGREYDYAGQIALADQWYQKALSLMTDSDQRKQSSCLYGEFIEKKLDNRPRACTLEKENCPADQQTACTAPASLPPSPSKNR